MGHVKKNKIKINKKELGVPEDKSDQRHERWVWSKECDC